MGPTFSKTLLRFYLGRLKLSPYMTTLGDPAGPMGAQGKTVT